MDLIRSVTFDPSRSPDGSSFLWHQPSAQPALSLVSLRVPETKQSGGVLSALVKRWMFFARSAYDDVKKNVNNFDCNSVEPIFAAWPFVCFILFRVALGSPFLSIC